MKLRLAQIAHARSGDKGDIADLSLFAWEPTGYDILAHHVTVDALREHFAHLWPASKQMNSASDYALPIERYELPKLLALKFVLPSALNGGATSSLRSDNLGKTIGAQLLKMEIDIPDDKAVTVLQATQQAIDIF
jgi:hypothetical protein